MRWWEAEPGGSSTRQASPAARAAAAAAPGAALDRQPASVNQRQACRTPAKHAPAASFTHDVRVVAVLKGAQDLDHPPGAPQLLHERHLAAAGCGAVENKRVSKKVCVDRAGRVGGCAAGSGSGCCSTLRQWQACASLAADGGRAGCSAASTRRARPGPRAARLASRRILCRARESILAFTYRLSTTRAPEARQLAVNTLEYLRQAAAAAGTAHGVPDRGAVAEQADAAAGGRRARRPPQPHLRTCRCTAPAAG